jgi:hypothetical protein
VVKARVARLLTHKKDKEFFRGIEFSASGFPRGRIKLRDGKK